MNQNVNPWVATIILSAFGALIAVAFWAYGEAAGIDGPSHMHRDPSGNIAILVHNRLVRHTAAGEFTRAYDLSALGVESMVGDFAFFSNGDLLIRRGKYDPGLLRGLAIYLRLTNTREPVAQSGQEGMFRCNLESATCSRFGSDALDFNETFHAYVDWRNDDVYIADTSRHVVRKFDRAGVPRGVQSDGLWYPNHIELFDDGVYVVNTNHHRIDVFDARAFGGGEAGSSSAALQGDSGSAQPNGIHDEPVTHPRRMNVVNPSTSKVGAPTTSFNVVPADAHLGDNVWPAFFARVGAGWWVNMMAYNMTHGRIVVFDAQWKFQRVLATPSHASPGALLALDNRVLISDARSDRVFQFDYDGNMLDDFDSPELRAVVGDVASLRSFYNGVVIATMVVFGAGIAAGVGVAVWQARRAVSANVLAEAALPQVSAEDPTVEWISPSGVQSYLFLIGGWIALVGAVPLLIVLPLAGYPISGILPLVPMAAGMIIAGISALMLRRARVGVRGNLVVLQDHRGRIAAGSGIQVHYTDSILSVGDVVVLIGNPAQRFFKDSDLERKVRPRLVNATRSSNGQMQEKMLRRGHPQFLFVFAAILMFVGMAAFDRLK